MRVAVNPLELLAWWEGRGGRRPLTVRDIARKLGISEATARKHLHALRAAGRVDDPARTRALAARRGSRRGGRPTNPLNDDALAATWEAQRRAASQRGTRPSIAAVARHLHVSRSRVRRRLQEIGLLEEPAASRQ